MERNTEFLELSLLFKRLEIMSGGIRTFTSWWPGLFLESGYFFVMPKVDLRPLRELFRAHVLKMLKKEGLIDDTFIKMLMCWRHVSGFNIHNEVRISPNDEKGMENLAQYIIRNTFSLE